MNERAVLRALPFLVAFGVIAVLSRAAGLAAVTPWFTPSLERTVYTVTLLAGSGLALGLSVLATIRIERLDRWLRAMGTLAKPDRKGPGGDPSKGTSVRGRRIGPPQGLAVRGFASGHDVGGSISLEREAIRDARGMVWPLTLGPVAGCLVFAGTAGIMLLGAGTPNERAVGLNTSLLLFLGYGWWLLLLWVVYSLMGVAAILGAIDTAHSSP